MRLTPAQELARSEFAAFADGRIAPYAAEWDRAERMPEAVIGECGERGYLGATIDHEYGGRGLDEITFGLLNAELGRACSSVRSLLTVHSMVAYAIGRWGTPTQRARWLPELASGRVVGAFAVTEPTAGSDVRAMKARAERTAGGFVLNGQKKWITFGRCAAVFLVFAGLGESAAAFLVERDRDGVCVIPQDGLLGTRASMVAEVRLDGCEVPATALLSRPGFGLSAVAASALELGRYSVAWGCVGLAEACVTAALDYADARRQFGRRLREHQLVAAMLADMVTETTAARLLCLHAGHLRQGNSPQSVSATWQAKYFSARAATRAANDAVQIHGAQGVGDAYPVQRFLRDAKVMEIIEGSTQMQQLTIAGLAYDDRTAGDPVAQLREIATP
jgi:alkylation response protein AidB-like acyl-CoA dehydrogenase